MWQKYSFRCAFGRFPKGTRASEDGLASAGASESPEEHFKLPEFSLSSTDLYHAGVWGCWENVPCHDTIKIKLELSLADSKKQTKGNNQYFVFCKYLLNTHWVLERPERLIRHSYLCNSQPSGWDEDIYLQLHAYYKVCIYWGMTSIRTVTCELVWGKPHLWYSSKYTMWVPLQHQ